MHANPLEQPSNELNDLFRSFQSSDSLDLTPNGKIRKEEAVRIVLQFLAELGYDHSVSALERESGFSLEDDSIASFKQFVLDGEWESLEGILPDLNMNISKEFSNILFLIREQKYLELLEQGQHHLAWKVLQKEIATLHVNQDRLHLLTTYLMISSSDDLKNSTSWDGATGLSRKRLLKDLEARISPSKMIPPNRLEDLLLQAQTYQKNQCLFHSKDSDLISLYSDHRCPSNFPSVTKHILIHHNDEVWHVSFSHNGKYVASASKDKTAIIWDIETFRPRLILSGHTDAVSYLSWSPDDEYLLTCGNDHTIRLWNTRNGNCDQVFTKHTESVTSCAWLPHGKSFVSSSSDKNILLWSLDGLLIHKWSNIRATCIAIGNDGATMVAACHEKKIRVFDLETKAEQFSIQEYYSITSLSLSQDNTTVIANLSCQKIHMWDLEEKTLLKSLKGQKQGRFVIRSCFGGPDECFILSGSEDSKVYAWHRHKGTLIAALGGHTDTVNSVSYNPKDPSMFASASDDHSIHIWGLP